MRNTLIEPISAVLLCGRVVTICVLLPGKLVFSCVIALVRYDLLLRVSCHIMPYFALHRLPM